MAPIHVAIMITDVSVVATDRKTAEYSAVLRDCLFSYLWYTLTDTMFDRSSSNQPHIYYLLALNSGQSNQVKWGETTHTEKVTPQEHTVEPWLLPITLKIGQVSALTPPTPLSQQWERGENC